MNAAIRRVMAVLLCTILIGPVAAREPARAADADEPKVRSAAVLVMDQETREILYSKNETAIAPIASITKLMTALVTLDADLPLDEEITIGKEDFVAIKGSRAYTRLRIGTRLTRSDLLKLALMASENLAAAALGRTYPGGLDAFVDAMNAKAQLIGMSDSRFVEPTGLSAENVSSPGDLVKLVEAAERQPLIREYTTASSHEITIGKRKVAFHNTNRLVANPSWEIGLQKTGFIRAAGRCLVMQANVAARPLVIVLLDSVGKYTRIGDANRLRKWLEDSIGLADGGTGVRRAAPASAFTAGSRTAYDSGSANGSRVRAQYPSTSSYW
jgi:D-alanyl-D-alanine endopeptidase (penicillin-binding protein 7)